MRVNVCDFEEHLFVDRGGNCNSLLVDLQINVGDSVPCNAEIVPQICLL